jgi:hypothetical protein
MEEKLFVRVGIKTIPAAEDSVFTIEKGMMDNITMGATCKIFRAGSNAVFAEAVIRKVENFRSIGVASKLLKRTDLYELKLMEEQYGDMQAGLKLSFETSAVRSAQIEEQVKQLIQPYRFLTLADNADFQLAIQQATDAKKAVLTDRNNKLLWSGGLTAADSFSAVNKTEMIASIKKAMRVKFLRTMADGGDLTGMVTVTLETEQAQDTLKGITLMEGDKYSLKIRNNSKTKLFYTVLDIYPDNRVDIIYPGKGKEPSDYIIEKESPVIRKLAVSKGTPEGREFLKVIVSKEPLDLRSVIDQKIERDEMRSFQLVLDDLFNETDPGKATRADISSIRAEEIGIVTVHFMIKKQ